MGLGSSIEDNIAQKLKFNELRADQQVKVLLEYFRSIMEGEVKTSPPELKGLLNLMQQRQSDDGEGAIQNYISSHPKTIESFFQENTQRFDRFEFKPLFLKIEGKDPEKAFKIPYDDVRNFEKIEPLDIRPYMEILEADQVMLQQRKDKTINSNAQAVQDSLKDENQRIIKQLQVLQQQIKTNIEKGLITKDHLMQYIRFAQENCIPALQIKYNAQAVDQLTEIFLNGVQKNMDKVFESLKMPLKQQEKFCEILKKKVVVK